MDYCRSKYMFITYLVTYLFRNIEDIYDKDILRLQNFQNLVVGDINKIKLDLTGKLITQDIPNRFPKQIHYSWRH